MEAATFFKALSLRAPLACNAPDPLSKARHIIEEHGETAENCARRRVISALANAEGEFSEAEVWLFSADTCALVSALVNARIDGRYTFEEWQGKNRLDSRVER